jgi:hypothetical protein
MELLMNETLMMPSMDADVNPTNQLLAELERRVLALEAKVAALPDPAHIEMHVTERIKASLPLPAPPVNPLQAPSFADITMPIPNVDTLLETARSTWTMLEMLGEFKALFWTLFDRRYHMAWMTRFIAIVLLTAIMTSDYWFPLATYNSILSQLWDKVVNIVLSMILFMVLIFETRRYKEWRKGR